MADNPFAGGLAHMIRDYLGGIGGDRESGIH
jgi:hypothetical protein